VELGDAYEINIDSWSTTDLDGNLRHSFKHVRFAG
jgi:hypothetical protein